MEEEFPKTLQEFGYAFNSMGQLRKLDPDTGKPGDEPFEFQAVPDNHHYNQRRYEALGEIINNYVYDLLETRGGLKKFVLSRDDCSSHSTRLESFIFVSDDVFTNTNKLVILIHGSGVVRAGQWARRLIINENLDMGTQLPFVEQAKREGYAVVVTNTNDNYRIFNGKKKMLHGSENPVSHLLSVWHQVIEKSPARHVAIIAHSYGGVCALELSSQVDLDKFRDRVFALAMTDSVHSMVHHPSIAGGHQRFLCQIGRNWVSSGQPLDAKIFSSPNDIERVSAGHTQHEMTSYSSMPSIFDFLRERLSAISNDENNTKNQD